MKSDYRRKAKTVRKLSEEKKYFLVKRDISVKVSSQSAFVTNHSGLVGYRSVDRAL